MSAASRPPDDFTPFSAQTRERIIRTAQTPLGFFVLVVLVVEVILGAKAMIDASSLPMVLFDAKLLVVHCNDPFASLLDSPASAILGQHVSELVRRLGERVPMDKRGEFLRRERAFSNGGQ